MAGQKGDTVRQSNSAAVAWLQHGYSMVYLHDASCPIRHGAQRHRRRRSAEEDGQTRPLARMYKRRTTCAAQYIYTTSRADTVRHSKQNQQDSFPFHSTTSQMPASRKYDKLFRHGVQGLTKKVAGISSRRTTSPVLLVCSCVLRTAIHAPAPARGRIHRGDSGQQFRDVDVLNETIVPFLVHGMRVDWPR
jgi:hypothetical protein